MIKKDTTNQMFNNGEGVSFLNTNEFEIFLKGKSKRREVDEKISTFAKYLKKLKLKAQSIHEEQQTDVSDAVRQVCDNIFRNFCKTFDIDKKILMEDFK